MSLLFRLQTSNLDRPKNVIWTNSVSTASKDLVQTFHPYGNGRDRQRGLSCLDAVLSTVNITGDGGLQ